ncbi:MAG: MmgE/PrpD family protein [Acidaminococcus provencensis]|jgi:2-methylcitrate dehydratase PrpD|uniref:MmgE/PrpD family protein n=1 Tax=Acidaminococcus provencensis TaxID=2058289 RepID=UPI0023F33B60|nr:MmgE/PrpD family protein [Acidaminococcus provencensis]MCH4096684.1 MmgE/PrpD family protein [Acidaminococcus provencensis]
MDELKKVSEFVADFSLEKVDENVKKSAKKCILDVVGLAMGAYDNPMFQQIKKVYLQADNQAALISNGNGAHLASIWGSNERTNLRTAVFFNAMLGHTLELDDVHTRSKTHIATVVVPAAWGLAEVLHKPGKKLLEAVICGYEVMSRIGMGFGVSSHRNKGWHVTSTAGTFGAAAACAKLLDFTPEQFLAALGLAGTQSFGTWAFLSDGATNKVLHPARAAASGLESCLLVLGGMRGSAHILDAKDGGIFPMMSDEYNYSLVDKDLGKVYEILQVDKKPYPCCRSSHCVIDGVLALRRENHLQAENVESIQVSTYLVGLKQCGLSDTSKVPKLPTQAKFSIPYVAACALLEGSVGLNDFLPEKIQRPEIQALLRKVTVREDSAFTARYPDHWGCKVSITLKNGETLEKVVKDASGSVYSPLTDSQLQAKVRTCCQKYDADWLNQLIDAILELDNLSTLPSLVYTR